MEDNLITLRTYLKAIMDSLEVNPAILDLPVVYISDEKRPDGSSKVRLVRYTPEVAIRGEIEFKSPVEEERFRGEFEKFNNMVFVN